MVSKITSKLTMPVLALCVLAVMACGVEAKVHARKTVRLNQNFVLRVKQGVHVGAEKLSVYFVSVPEDSRCPKGVTCIWAGSVRVRVEVMKANSKPVNIELSLNPRDFPDGETSNFDNYRIKLVGVEPYPVKDQQLTAKDYAVTLNVSKK